MTLAVPEFVKVTVWELLLPTATLPKLMLAGLAPRRRLTPMPDKAIACGLPEALSVITTAELRVPVVDGVKVILIVQLPFGAKVAAQLLV